MSLNYTEFFKDKTILIPGGTGSIGSETVKQLLTYDVKAIRILSNSENELWETQQKFIKYDEKLRFLLGDIRNYDRVKRAMTGVDYVFNAAAIKHVPLSEYNPMEAVRVNILGLENIIQAAANSNVKKLIQISTDKSINPSTVMGATKMIGERLSISRQLTIGMDKMIISCVRFGNVLGSRGSIIPLIKDQISKRMYVTLTHEAMKRFFMTIPQAVGLILKAITLSRGGEIFVLKMPILVIKDLIEVIIEEYAPRIGKNPQDIEIKIIGPRAHEKFDEELIALQEFSVCYEMEDMYIIYPSPIFSVDPKYTVLNTNGTKIIKDENFKYSTECGEPVSKEYLKKYLIENNLI
ncbi:MAG: SDR family NAD(P)-dependent oxidoreductase [Candidatus Lokiarchaeota archaeon]|nr:SDR family NAD(P)-dependent oxidoreductase [Candidatus Lokiarchaeota archaeon]